MAVAWCDCPNVRLPGSALFRLAREEAVDRRCLASRHESRLGTLTSSRISPVASRGDRTNRGPVASANGFAASRRACDVCRGRGSLCRRRTAPPAWSTGGRFPATQQPGGCPGAWQKAPARTKRNTKLSRAFRYAPATRARSGLPAHDPLAVKHPSGSRTLFRSARLASATGNSSHDPRFVRDGVHRSTEPKVTGSSPVGCTLDKGQVRMHLALSV